MSALRRWSSLVVLVGAVLLLAIDSTVLNLAIPALTAELEPTATQVLWIGDIYSIAIAGLLVTMGSLADRIGRKRLLLIGSTAFGLASLLAALAPSAEVLIAARFALGVAGATIMPSTLSLIRNIFEVPQERTRAIAIWSAAASSGIALGPLVGGALLDRFWWGSVFLINIPVMLVVVALGAWLLPESKDPRPGRLDLTSSALSMVAIVPLVLAIKDVSIGESGIRTIIALIVSAIGGHLFVRRQTRIPTPMLDVRLFRVPAFTGAVLVAFISVFALSGFTFFYSQYLQLARGLSPLEAGVTQIPVAISVMAAMFFVGLLLARLGRGKAMAVALILAAAGLALVALFESSEHLVWLILALLPIGLGIGIAETLSVDAVVSAVSPAKAGAAASVSETAYELGVAMGIAVLGSLLTALYRLQLVVSADVPAALKAQVRDSLASAASVLDPSSPGLHHAQQAFVSSMQMTTLVAAAVMAVAGVVAWKWIPSERGSSNVDH